jgi:translation initiation factor IF-2
MSVSLKDLAEKLNSSVEELTTKLQELDFSYDEENLEVEDDLAELLEDELGQKTGADAAVAAVEMQLEREIVKKQRKKMAGKHESKAKEKNVQIKVDKLEIGEVISVKELAEKTGVNAAKIIGELMKSGIIANINQQLDFDTALLVAGEFGIDLKKTKTESSTAELLEGNLEAIIGEEDKEDLEERPPIITIMGHVDHGKTKLLDSIRSANVVEGESGGITQHIGAYQVTKNGKKITFLDTPGHEAFTAMRARGAKVTDIAILVVAATEGVKPTTIEAINHAKDAGVPIIVAINKMDLPNANPDKVKTELVEYGLQAEDWGGDTIMVPVSALKGEGIDKLLEMILIVAEVEDLKANSTRAAVASVIETHLDPGLGPVATVVINTGTLKIGDAVVVGDSYGKVKAMIDDHGKRVKKAPPSFPVQIAGLSKTPQTGDILQVYGDEKAARDRVVEIAAIRKSEEFRRRGSMQDIVAKIRSGELQVLKVIVKADTEGSIEAIQKSLDEITHEEVMVKIIHSGVGAVTESDVMMASAAGAIIFGFHVDLPAQVETSAERTGTTVKLYKIIYELINETKNILSGLLTPEIVTVEQGKADVRQIFFTKKKEMIVGLKVTNGFIRKDSKLRVTRGGEEIGEGLLLSLQKVDKVVEEVNADNECGIKFKGIGGLVLQEGDVIEAYTIEEREKTLE